MASGASGSLGYASPLRVQRVTAEARVDGFQSAEVGLEVEALPLERAVVEMDRGAVVGA